MTMVNMEEMENRYAEVGYAVIGGTPKITITYTPVRGSDITTHLHLGNKAQLREFGLTVRKMYRSYDFTFEDEEVEDYFFRAYRAFLQTVARIGMGVIDDMAHVTITVISPEGNEVTTYLPLKGTQRMKHFGKSIDEIKKTHELMFRTEDCKAFFDIYYFAYKAICAMEEEKEQL